MKPVGMEDYNYWRPVYSTNPITNDRCEIVTKKSDVPRVSQLDSYASNEYITKYLNKGYWFIYPQESGDFN